MWTVKRVGTLRQTRREAVPVWVSKFEPPQT
jgi:hypothetical protein